MSSATNFPTTVDALDAAWLSSALGYEVRNFDVQHFSEGAGVIGLVTRVLLESDEGPSSIIAKFPSPVPENRAVAETYGMYEREVSFYRDIAARLEVRTPDCFFVAHDPATQDFILLLEDMQDFQIGDQTYRFPIPAGSQEVTSPPLHLKPQESNVKAWVELKDRTIAPHFLDLTFLSEK